MCEADEVEALAALHALVCARIASAASCEVFWARLRSLVLSTRAKVAQHCGIPTSSAVRDTPDVFQWMNGEDRIYVQEIPRF